MAAGNNNGFSTNPWNIQGYKTIRAHATQKTTQQKNTPSRSLSSSQYNRNVCAYTSVPHAEHLILFTGTDLIRAMMAIALLQSGQMQRLARDLLSDIKTHVTGAADVRVSGAWIQVCLNWILSATEQAACSSVSHRTSRRGSKRTATMTACAAAPLTPSRGCTRGLSMVPLGIPSGWVPRWLLCGCGGPGTCWMLRHRIAYIRPRSASDMVSPSPTTK